MHEELRGMFEVMAAGRSEAEVEDLRERFEIMSSVPRQPGALREGYRRRRDELRARFPNQWVLYRLSFDYATCESVLEIQGAYATIQEAVEAENALPPEERRFTLELVQPVDRSVVYLPQRYFPVEVEGTTPSVVEG